MEIFKVGMPLKTDEDHHTMAERLCREAYASWGKRVTAIHDVKDVTTDAHRRAGECLYRLEIETVPKTGEVNGSTDHSRAVGSTTADVDHSGELVDP